MADEKKSGLELFGKILLLVILFGATVGCFVYTGGTLEKNPGIQILGAFGVIGTILAFINVID